MKAAEPYLEQLRAIPFIKGASFRPARDPAIDGVVRLKTPDRTWELTAELKTSHLGPATVREVIARAGPDGASWILLAPYVSRPSATLLARAGINFVDRGGNHRLALGRSYQSTVLGNPVQQPPDRGASRLAGHRVQFALLVRPELASAPVRAIAAAAGTSKNAAADALRRLEAERLVVRTSRGRQLVGARALRSRWVAAYAAVVRPQLLVGRFEHRLREPGARESAIETELAGRTDWAFGGTSAAYRLAPHYRGPDTTLVLADRAAVPELARTLRLLPADRGSVLLFAAPGPLALEGPIPRVVHPLLAYAELLSGDDERATEAAAELAERHLGTA